MDVPTTIPSSCFSHLSLLAVFLTDTHTRVLTRVKGSSWLLIDSCADSDRDAVV